MAKRTPSRPRTQKAADAAPESTIETLTESAADIGSGSQSMASEPTEADIRMRAYQRYLERGGGHGQDFDDWLEAERELKGRG
jgi:hypothetical protein